MQRGTGGLASTSVIVRAVVLSAGRTYQGRVATPLTQLAADVSTEVAQYIHEYINNLPVDPKLDERCMLQDDNGEPLVKAPADRKFKRGFGAIPSSIARPVFRD